VNLLGQSLTNTWAPFVLIVGLLFIGHVAANEGLFSYVGARCAQLPGGDVELFVVTMVAVALVTAVLNLDTAVVFMTPVALHAARTRSADETAFLYGTVLMTNSASLLLIGSNLTNLLVFASRPVQGIVFARHMALPWALSVLVTILVVVIWRWTSLRHIGEKHKTEAHRFSWGPGVVAVVVAIVMMLSLSNPALPVVAVGGIVEGYEWLVKKRVGPRGVLKTANLAIVAPLFVLAVLVGWLGRSWTGPSHLVAHANSLLTALIAAGTSVVINNLPAASLFAGRRIAHPYALLIGLNLGPNLFMSGAMSTLLWFRIARGNGAQPSSSRFVKIGVPVALLTMILASLVV
jgi:arsenical pump membrane protein